MNLFARLDALYKLDLASRSLVVRDADSELADVAPLHAHHGPGLLRRCNPEYARQLDGVPELPLRQVLLSSKLEHEIDHLQRLAATSYGFLLHSALALELDAWFRHVLETPEFALRFPLNFRSTAAGRLRRGASGLSLLLQADALGPAAYRNLDEGSVLAALEHLGLQTRGPTRPKNLRAPVVNTRVGPLVFGGQALLELFAVARECSLVAFGPGQQHLPDYSSSHLHLLTQTLWKEVYALPMPLTAPDSPAWRVRDLTARSRFPLETYIAADLALWVPFSPDGWVGAPAWEDIHPGWRYVRILELLREQSAACHPFASPSSVTDSLFDQLQSDWCQRLGWPRPAELRAAWQATWIECAQGDATRRRPWVIGDDDQRVLASADYLRTRELNPSASVLSYMDTRGIARLWFQVFACFFDRPTSTGRDPIEIYTPDTKAPKWAEAGYHFPPAFSLSIGIPALTAGAASHTLGVPDSTALMLRATQRRLAEDITRYAQRHYGAKLEFDGWIRS